ncbi:MAG: hypothetical protein ACE5IO_09560, partial [Thermoplasmata archaeon]
MKLVVASTKEPEKRTWVEKVTDDKNYWLLARNLEKDGLLREAVHRYLKDASEQREKNILRTALSVTCAGRCLARLGKTLDASRLFIKALRFYESAMKSARLSSSDRDWLSERISYCRR